MKKKLFIYLLFIAFQIPHTASAVQYEPPINIFFIIHVEELPDPANEYPIRIQFLEWLSEQAQIRPNPFKITVLMNGDFAEYAYNIGDKPFFEQLEAEGHELGTHAHTQIQIGPESWWQIGGLTARYGIPVYNDSLTQVVWYDAKSWVDSLTTQNNNICAMPFLCSTEAQLMADNGLLGSPGNRSEKCLDYLGYLMRHPFRPGSDNRLGHQLEEDLDSPFIYLDHYAQIGNSNAHGYDCTARAMSEAIDDCYNDWLTAEMTQGDSLDYKVWTFGFLTHLWVYSPYYEDQITQLLDHIDSLYVGHYTPRGNLIARYATAQEINLEFIEWENSHPGVSSFSYVQPYPEVPLINEAMIVPDDSTYGSEWIEIYNPTDEWIDISGYELTNGLKYTTDFWRFPPQSRLGPYEYLIAANNGNYFRIRYGFRPDFEVTGNTGARPFFTSGNYVLHDTQDGCTIVNNDPVPPNSNTAITDGLSWGNDYVAGFTLDQPVVDVTYGRDENSTDTGYGSDWYPNGGAQAPTPGGINSNTFFGPEIFVRTDIPWTPMTVPANGGNIQFSVKIGNEFSTTQTTDIWTDVLLPNGVIYGPIIVRENRQLAPQDSFTFNASQSVPAGAPGGNYRYQVYAGTYPSDVASMDYFYFYKDGMVTEGDLSWPEPDMDEIGFAISEKNARIMGQANFTFNLSPNPFNPSTVISYKLPTANYVSLKVFDIQGREIATLVDGYRSAGSHEVTFDGSGLASGVYIYRLEADNQHWIGKMVLMK